MGWRSTSTGWTEGRGNIHPRLRGWGDRSAMARSIGDVHGPRKTRAHGKFRLPSRNICIFQRLKDVFAFFIASRVCKLGNRVCQFCLRPAPAKPGPSAGFRSGAESPTIDG